MIRLLAGDFRGEVEGSRARMAAVVSVLNHPGHPDQKIHGRKGGATGQDDYPVETTPRKTTKTVKGPKGLTPPRPE